MKFKCERVSNRLSSIQPCEEAVEGVDGKWVVELHDLDGLLSFIKKYDSVVIQNGFKGYEFDLEIYDYYRE